MENIHSTWQMVKRLGRLYVDGARLVLAERLTRLLAAVVIFVVVYFLAIAILVLVSIFATQLLLNFLPDYWCYLIIAGFFLLLIGTVMLLRKPLIVNPIARFISTLIVEPPTTPTSDDNAQTT